MLNAIGCKLLSIAAYTLMPYQGRKVPGGGGGAGNKRGNTLDDMAHHPCTLVNLLSESTSNREGNLCSHCQ